MTAHGGPPRAVGIRDVLRWWPIVVVMVLIAVAASILALTQRSASYTATTRLVITPLVQWDETFLGTSLVRDAGDATRTPTTVAELLDSRPIAAATATDLGGSWTADSVAAAVAVTAVSGVNVVDVVATSNDPAQAVKLAETFADTALAQRWQTISGELDARIALMGKDTSANPNAGESSTRLQQLKLVRQGGVDPTLKIESTSPAERVSELAAGTVVGLAVAGGLFLGVLVAVGIARVRRRPPSVPPPAVPAPARVPPSPFPSPSATAPTGR